MAQFLFPLYLGEIECNTQNKDELRNAPLYKSSVIDLGKRIWKRSKQPWDKK